MKRLWNICRQVFVSVSILIIISVPLISNADLFSQASRTDDEVIYRAGGYLYKMPEGGNTEKLVDLGISLNNNGGCGQFDLATSLKSLFNTAAWKNFFTNVAKNAVASAPLLLASYASPTLVNAYMHMQNSLEKILSIRESQCQEVEKAAIEYGMLQRAKAEGKYNCILQKQQKGEQSNEAIKECMGKNNSPLHILPLDAKNSNNKNNLNLSKDIKNMFGMDSNDYKFFHTLVGDVQVNGHSILDQENPNAAQKVYNQELQETQDEVRRIVDSVKSGSVDEADIEKIYKESGIYISPSLVTVLSNLKASNLNLESVYENMLANRITLYKLKSKILKIQKELQMAEQKATVQGSKSVVDVLQEKEKDLQLQEQEIENRYQAAQSASQLALQIIQQRNVQSFTNASEFKDYKNHIKVKSFENSAGNPEFIFKGSPAVKQDMKTMDEKYGNSVDQVLGR